MDGAMQTSDRVTFRQLMEAWAEDFNAASTSIQICYENFTGFYSCIKLYKKEHGPAVTCAGHLYEDPKPGIEIPDGSNNPIFIPAEDPTLFQKLIARVEHRYRELLTDKSVVDNGDILTCD